MSDTISMLREMLAGLEEKEHETIFEAAHALGEAVGRKRQTADIIRKLEEVRPTVDRGGVKAETGLHAVTPEKR